MLITLNIISLIIILHVAAQTGWLGETIQFKINKGSEVDEKYDREILLALALVQTGNGTAKFNSSGFIEIETENHQWKLYASDYRSEAFGECYSHRMNRGYWSREDDERGCLTLSTRKYLKKFKEEYLGVVDPSSTKSGTFKFKKEKVTLE